MHRAAPLRGTTRSHQCQGNAAPLAPLPRAAVSSTVTGSTIPQPVHFVSDRNLYSRHCAALCCISCCALYNIILVRCRVCSYSTPQTRPSVDLKDCFTTCRRFTPPWSRLPVPAYPWAFFSLIVLLYCGSKGETAPDCLWSRLRPTKRPNLPTQSSLDPTYHVIAALLISPITPESQQSNKD